MMQEVGKFNLFDRVRTLYPCSKFYESGAIGEIVSTKVTEGKGCWIKFSEGEFAKDSEGIWFASYENLELVEDDNV